TPAALLHGARGDVRTESSPSTAITMCIEWCVCSVIHKPGPRVASKGGQASTYSPPGIEGNCMRLTLALGSSSDSQFVQDVTARRGCNRDRCRANSICNVWGTVDLLYA